MMPKSPYSGPVVAVGWGEHSEPQRSPIRRSVGFEKNLKGAPALMIRGIEMISGCGRLKKCWGAAKPYPNLRLLDVFLSFSE